MQPADVAKHTLPIDGARLQTGERRMCAVIDHTRILEVLPLWQVVEPKTLTLVDDPRNINTDRSQIIRQLTAHGILRQCRKISRRRIPDSKRRGHIRLRPTHIERQRIVLQPTALRVWTN